MKDVYYITLEDAERALGEDGFIKFHNMFASEGSVGSFQKKYRSGDGVKYFINAELWYNHIGNAGGYSVEYSGQFYKKGTHDAVNMTFIGWGLKDIEKWLDEMFDKGLLESYSTE